MKNQTDNKSISTYELTEFINQNLPDETILIINFGKEVESDAQ